jgi:hypothetical protein
VDSLDFAVGIGGLIATIMVAVGVVVLVQYLVRRHSHNALQPYADLRGWSEVPKGGKSLIAHGVGAGVAGEWNGARAELVMTRVYKGRTATVVAVASSQTTPSGLPPLGPVSIMAKGDVSFQYYKAQFKRADLGLLQTSALGQRFGFLGKASDVLALITPEIAQSLVSFAGQINNAGYDGEAASVTWLGFERDPARIDAALEVAGALSLQAAARRDDA